MSKSYDHKIEESWRLTWFEKNLYEVLEEDLKNPDFSVTLPPPNVTGGLHLGHALNASLQDILVRYHRMNGKKVHYQIGFDHAGIGTQIVIEKQLAQENTSREELGRVKFQERILSWSKENQERISRQLKLIGISADFKRSIFTLDESYIQSVQKYFFELYKQNLVYKGKRLINWCPNCLTSLSDLETVHKEQKAFLYQIKYKIPESRELGLENFSELIVATSRPETIFADVAVAVNPEDKRYQELINLINSKKKIELEIPISKRKIKLILSKKVEIGFGTGALKITPAHDFNDYEIAEEGQLEKINILNQRAQLVGEYVPENFRGLDRIVAREKVLEELEKLELLESKKEYLQSIVLHDRCNNVIEPLLSKQWFVRMKPLACIALDAVNTGKIKFYPKRYSYTYTSWLENIKDWCISRQLWWGHKILVFSKELYKLKKGSHQEIFKQLKKVYLKHDYRVELKADAKYPSFLIGKKEKNRFIFQITEERAEIVLEKEDLLFQKELTESLGYEQEKDVLDTWFSSALWPFASQGWINNIQRDKSCKRKQWTNVLVTARDIINLWVSRMVYSSLNLTKLLPFEEILIHPVIQTPTGKRMSKSKGTGIDPLRLIEKYGADACRLWYCSVGIFSVQDKKFPGKKEKDGSWSSSEIENYRKFLNKLWNIKKFVVNVSQKLDYLAIDIDSLDFIKLFKSSMLLEDSASIWILSRLNQLIERTRRNLEDYRYTEFVEELKTFTWSLFCDWYLEICKINFDQKEKRKIQENNFQVLIFSFQEIIKLLHPVVPFITEELFYDLAVQISPKKRNQSLSFESYPKVSDLSSFLTEKELQKIEQEIIIIQTVRSIKQNILGLPANYVCELKVEGLVLSFIDLAKVSLVKNTGNKALIKKSLENLTLELVIPDTVDLEKRKLVIKENLEKKIREIKKLEGQLVNSRFRQRVSEEILKNTQAEYERKLKESKELEEALSLIL